MVAIIGSSGSGKTTLLNILAGRIKGGTVSGDIRVNNKPRPKKLWQHIVGYAAILHF